MFGIGFSEFIVIGIVALLVIGPEKLPGMARTIGRFTWEMRRAWEDVRDTVKDEMSEVREPLDQLRKAGKDTAKRFRDETQRMRETAENTIRETRNELKGAVVPAAATLRGGGVAEIEGKDGESVQAAQGTPVGAGPSDASSGANASKSAGKPAAKSDGVAEGESTETKTSSSLNDSADPGNAPAPANQPEPFRRTKGRGVAYYDLDGNVID